jgi:hypothetical protein
MGTPILAGRDFGDEDNQTSPPVVIVNEAFARKFFAGAVAMGQTLTEQQALGDELPHQAPTRSANRQANGDLALAGRGARQQQVGQVHARDRQH